MFPGIGGWLGPATWAVYAAFTLVVVAATGRWREVGLLDTPRPGWLRLIAVPFAAGLPFLLFGWNLEADAVVPLLVVGVPLVALNEELMFRGILLDLLGPLGVRRAVIWTAVLFGCSHLVNIVAGAYPPFTAMQVAATTAGGVAFAAIRIRSGSLWPLLVLHAAIDVVAIATLTGPATSSPILLPVLFGWLAANLALWRYGWWVLRTTTDDGGAQRPAPAPGGAPAA
jgi:membrane protease YdiL (CAAX protease family)